MKNIYVFAFATFGHPNDFRQSPYVFDEKSFAQNIKIFDLSNAIKVFPDSEIYAIRKEVVNGCNAVSYSIYTYAREQQSTREGTFIGSSIIYSNKIAEENITIKKLSIFHKALVDNNTKNDTLIVNHSKDFSVPKDVIYDLEKDDYCFREINNIDKYIASNNNMVVYTRMGPVVLYNKLKCALDVLNKYDSIYFTDNKDVVDYVAQRNIYTVVDEDGFEQERKNIQKEKKNNILKIISYLENEGERFKEKGKKVISDLEDQLEYNQKIHFENQEYLNSSSINIDKVEKYYNDYLRRIEDYKKRVEFGDNLHQIRKLYEEDKKKINNDIVELKSQKYIKNIQAKRWGSDVQIERQFGSVINEPNKRYNKKNVYQNRSDAVDMKQAFVFVLVLVVLFSLTIIYFLLTHQ